MSAPIVLRREAGALHITLSRPHRKNAMSFAMVDALLAALAEVSADEGVRAIVLRGAEGNFCSGGDIKDMAAMRGAEPGPDGREDRGCSCSRKFFQFNSSQVPVKVSVASTGEAITPI